MKSMRKLPENLAQGQAGTYSVAAQLLLRGHNPAFPAVDIGADIVLDSGIKIQVKSAHLGFTTAYRSGCYAFKLATRIVVKSQRRLSNAKRIFSQECDFVVLWGIEENRFWVIPSAILDDKSAVYVGPKCSWVDADLVKLREAKEQGKTFRQIAKESGVSLSTTFRTLNGREQGDRTAFTRIVRDHEGRWEILDDYLKAIEVVDGVQPTDAPVVDWENVKV